MFPEAQPFLPCGSSHLGSYKVTNLQGKLQKSSVHVNRMKRYFTISLATMISQRQELQIF